MDNGNGTSTGISPTGMSPVMSEAARAQLIRQREREKEQERRRREAKAGGIDMNMQSDLVPVL
jgi:C-terminal domain of bromodomain protein 4